MKIKIQPKILLEVLGVLKKVIPAKTMIPACEDILFKTAGGELYLTTSEGTTFLQVKLPLEDKKTKDGEALVPADKFIELLSNLKSEEIELNFTNELLTVTWPNGNAKIPTFVPKDFPECKVPEGEETVAFDIDAKVFGNIVNHVVNITANDPMRPMVSQILFDIKTDDKSKAVATNLKALAIMPLPVKLDKEAKIFFPDNILRLARDCAASVIKKKEEDEETKISVNNGSGRIQITCDNFTLTASTVSGKFVPYESIVQNDEPYVLNIDKDELISSLKRVIIASARCTSVVTFEITGSSLKTSIVNDIFKAKATEDLQFCNYCGENITIAFNGEDLATLLSLFDSKTVDIAMTGPKKPVFITAENTADEPFLGIISPVPATAGSNTKK